MPLLCCEVRRARRVIRHVDLVIPSAAIAGVTGLPFDLGALRPAPPDRIDVAHLEAVRDADRFRLANPLAAWTEVDEGG